MGILENLNSLALGIYLTTIGAVVYLLARGLKKLLDILCDALLQKYISSVRAEVKRYLDPIREKLDTLEEDVDSVKRHESANAKLQIGTMNQLLAKLDKTHPEIFEDLS